MNREYPMSCHVNCASSAGLAGAVLYFFGGLLIKYLPAESVLSLLQTLRLNTLIPFFVYIDLSFAALIMGAVQMFVIFFSFFYLKSIFYARVCGAHCDMHKKSR